MSLSTAMPAATGRLAALQAHWDYVRGYLHGFRIAWVPTISAIAGVLLFLVAPQAQDLFLDVRGGLLQGAWYWLTFYTAVLLVWMLPVYVSARWILWQCRMGRITHPDARAVTDDVRRMVPPVLAVGCLLAVLIGQALALVNVPDLIDVSQIEQTLNQWKASEPAACGAKIELSSASLPCVILVGRLFGTGTLWFLSEWHIGSEWMILLLYACLAVLLAWFLAGWRLRQIASRRWRLALSVSWWLVTIVMLPINLLLALMFAGLLADEADQPYTLVHLALLPGVTIVLGWLLWLAARPRETRPESSQEKRLALQRVRPLMMLLIVLAIAATFLLFLVHPDDVANAVHRVVMVPYLLGPLVPPLTYLSYLSIRVQAPLVLAGVGLLGFVGLVEGDRYAVRTLTLPADAQRYGLDETVGQWRAANGCAERASDCPAPIIVSAAGGASRAGFLVGGLIGKLLDERAEATSIGGTQPLRRFDRQLFAISGVSGGSLGAAVTYAALADARDDAPPCRKNRWQHDDQWFLAGRDDLDAQKMPNASWRSCLELLLSGDFLSPVFVRMISNDLVGIGGDRAIALEQSWERRYEEMTGHNTLAEPLTAVRQRAVNGKGWLPVLLLNGTSVETGRRIVTSDVAVPDRLPAPEITADRMLIDAYDLHSLLESRAPQHDPVAAQAVGALPSGPTHQSPRRDVALSTAATMSARFPVISPHGSIIGADGRIVQRVVDGGYYENFGATTALELARVLKARYGLTPMVILVNNEPATAPIDCIDDDQQNFEPAIPSQRTWFSILTSPLEAVGNTRNARGTYAAVDLCTFLKSSTTNGALAFITVKPSGSKPLSMSWWLSKHVQQYLDLHLGGATGSTPATSRERRFTEVNRAAFETITKTRR
jgi:hypothetical protein